MKKSMLSISCLCSFLFSGASIASGPSAEIKVLGELASPTCDVMITNNGAFDYGTINHSKIQSDRAVSIGVKNGSLNVKCSADTPLTFKVTDNRLGTASMVGDEYLGLGTVNGSGKMGYYTVRMFSPLVDGKMSEMFVTAGSTIAMPKNVVTLEHGKRAGWVLNGTQEVAIGKVFSAELITEAFLAKRSDMNGAVGEGNSIDGSATLEFGFGL